ncbi:DUF4190 domain-containing protein [Pseudonocardia sediminis]|uniref:DUF4190 domain-containing protein n=1 Tax=Pseudonocardia sediminis TaxID=1397368 RepID=UPI001028BE98|nr:DUF4190 domain-containing protein [Pseudonocardia sediminis]
MTTSPPPGHPHNQPPPQQWGPPPNYQQPHYAPAPRNGLGIAALVLGICGFLSGLIPFFFWFALIAGVIGLILGLVGFSRTRKGVATNKKTSIAGVVLSVLSVAMGIWGAVILFQGLNQLATDLGAPTNTAPAAVAPAGQMQDADGLQLTAEPLTVEDSYGTESLCTAVSYNNTSSSPKTFNMFDWQLLGPTGATATPGIGGSGDALNSGSLVPGGTTEGTVCFTGAPASGEYRVIYSPANTVWTQTR